MIITAIRAHTLVIRAPQWSQPPTTQQHPHHEASSSQANHTVPAHPADVIHLSRGAPEARPNPTDNTPQPLVQALRLLRETMPFLEQQTATQVTQAIQHIHQWVGQHWESEDAVLIDSQTPSLPPPPPPPHTETTTIDHAPMTHDHDNIPPIQAHHIPTPELETPELEESIRLAHLLADQSPGQPRTTREERRQDLQTIATLFRTAIRRGHTYQLYQHEQHTPTKAETEAQQRGERACQEAIQILNELSLQTALGMRVEHMAGLLEQVIVRAHTAREAHETLHEAMVHRETETLIPPPSSTPPTIPWPPSTTPGELPTMPSTPQMTGTTETNLQRGHHRLHDHGRHQQRGDPRLPDQGQHQLPEWTGDQHRRAHRLPEHRRRREHDGASSD